MKVGIIGGGVIGLSLGWQLLRREVEVTLFDANKVTEGASHVAAGMLAPYAEVGFEELELMKLGEQSLRLYPDFLKSLSEDVGRVPVLDQCGTLIVGLNRDDAAYIKRLYAFRQDLELPVQMMTGSEARDREPLLSPKVVSALWLPEDAQIDNLDLIHCLKQAFENRGGVIHENERVTAVNENAGSVHSLSTESADYVFDAVVVAAGCWSSDIAVPAAAVMSVRPVKGQIITLEQTRDCALGCMVRSPRMYLVPKLNGTLRLGASMEDKGFDTRLTAGVQKDLLQDAFEAVPSIYDLPVVTAMAGLRPASRDHAPLIGETSIKKLYGATGHYRHGILLAPVTAVTLAAEISGDSACSTSFSPTRYDASRSGSGLGDV